jgi:hypothetical protein
VSQCNNAPIHVSAAVHLFSLLLLLPEYMPTTFRTTGKESVRRFDGKVREQQLLSA